MASEKIEELQKMAEELVEKAKANNIDLSLEDAKAFLEESSKTGELSDDELSQAVGGDMMEEARNIVENWMREHHMNQPKSRVEELEEISKRVSEERKKYYADYSVDVLKH